jgi:tRNA A-37 threonylcarbamoyl transferase component Bud32
MEYIEYDTLKKFINKLKINNIHSICNELSDKINSIIDCMEYYDIYHNDLHPDNILINYNKKNGIFKIYIIDFGESSNSLIKFNNVKYNCQKINLYITPINVN